MTLRTTYLTLRTLALGLMLTGSHAFGQLVGITWEVDTAFYEPMPLPDALQGTPQANFDEEDLLNGFVTYQLYANFTNSTDKLSSVFADVAALATPAMYVDAPCGCFNPELGDVLVGGAQNPAFEAVIPEVIYDTYWTVGMTPGEQMVTTNVPPYTSLNMCSDVILDGLVLLTSPPEAGDDLRILVAQITTCGDWSFHACFQVFIEGDQGNVQQYCMDGDGSGPLEVESPCADWAGTNSSVEVTTPINCYGELATVNVLSGGAPEVTFELLNAADSTLVMSQTGLSSISGIGEGDYIVAIVDGNTCRDTTDVFSFVNPPELVADWVLEQDNQCAGVNSVLVQGSATGGTNPLEFIAEHPLGFPVVPNQDTTWTTLDCIDGNGTYNFSATDFNGCSVGEVIVISCPEDIVIDVEPIDVSCFDYGDGGIEGWISGGTGLLSLTSVPDLGAALEGSPINVDISNLGPGMYALTVLDENGCDAETSVEVLEPSTVTVTYTPTDIGCANECNGSITYEASGGSGEFTFFVTDMGGATEEANALCAGDYIAYTQDANGCVVDEEISINEPPAIVFEVAVSNVSCAGQSDGSICVENSSGGTGSLLFQVDPPALGFGTEPCFDLPVGTFSITAQDEAGCEVTQEGFTLTEPEPIELIMSLTHITCTGFDNGMVDVSAIGGTGELTLLNPFASELPTTVTDLSLGAWDIVVVDENNCQQLNTIEILEPDTLQVEVLSTNDILCGGDCNGTALVDFSGGTGATTFLLNGNEFFDLGSMCAGDYTAMVTDVNGCVDSALFSILEPTPIEVLLNVTDVTCTGMNDGAVNIFPVGGTGELDWAVLEEGIDLDNLYEGTYNITAVDESGCVEDTSFTVGALEVTDMEVFMLSSAVTCWNEEDGTATASVVGGHFPIVYLWSDALAQSTPTATGLSEDTYSVVILDDVGCTISASVAVDPTVGCLFIADALTPNGDGYNDEWIVGGLEYFPSATVSVFNRYGQLLFESVGYTERWDGRFNNAPLAVADYYYVIDFSNGSDPITGTVTLKY